MTSQTPTIVKARFVATSVNCGEGWLLDTLANRAAWNVRAERDGGYTNPLRDDTHTVEGYGVMFADSPQPSDVYVTQDAAERAIRIWLARRADDAIRAQQPTRAGRR